MSTVRRRRHSPAVYRRRRLAVLLVLLLIVTGIVLAIWQPWKGTDAGAPGDRTPGTSSGPVTPGETSSGTPDATGSAGASAPASDSASPSPGGTADDALAPCTAADVTVTAVTDRESYGAGQKPQLSIELTNESAQDCTMDVGTATQQFTITSGVDVWWRSTDCQSEPSSYVVTLEAGQTVSTSTPLEWDRTRSRTNTCDGDRPNAGAGTYRLVVVIGGVESEPTRFELR